MADLREDEIERGTKALLVAVGILLPLAVAYRLTGGRMWLAIPLAGMTWLALRSLFGAWGSASERKAARELAEAKARQLAKRDPPG